MVEKIGACKFCGQNHMVRVFEDANQEEIVMEASRICSCPDGQRLAEIETNINVTKEAIRNSTTQSSNIREILLEAVDSVGQGIIDNVAIKKDKTSFSLKRTAKGGIKFEIKTVTVEVKES